MPTEIIAILIAFVIGALATAVGQYVIAREARLDRKETRDAERVAREEASEQKRRSALSELAAELRLNAAMPENSWHHTIAGSWIPFRLDAYDRARPYLSDVPHNIRDSIIEACALVTLYNTYSRTPPPTNTQEWDRVRRDEPMSIRRSLAQAADELASWLSKTDSSAEDVCPLMDNN